MTGEMSTPIPVVVGVSAIGSCVLWAGFRNRKGYGQRWVNGRMMYAHRYAWAEVHGDPGASHVCHRCDVPACINVAHLFLGTPADNAADRVAKGRQVNVSGERHPNAKLTVDQVREIRASTECGAAIGRRLGVATGTVSKIRLRQQWAHIE